MTLARRTLMKTLAATGAAAALPARALPPPPASWQSLADGNRTPDWFRDAKFGIWAHWGPQCVPEHGDWYGRLMYVQSHEVYRHHLATYGHPANFGFMQFIGRWKAERWDPAALMARYKRAGARYFMTMANHHDNFDMFDSAHHEWNSTRVGPMRDIVGTWEKLAREAGLCFAVSNHSSHAWHWWQVAYGYDAEGPRKGDRYDAFKLTKADGKGQWWEGLDPQKLYTGPTYVPPAGIDTIAAMDSWHGARDGQWLEDVPPERAWFAQNWLARQRDLVAKYKPDMVYFDDSGIPFGGLGLTAVEEFYRASLERSGIQGVVTAKRLNALQRLAITEDVERGFVAEIQERPWQTDTCIGGWHYDRRVFDQHSYKSAKSVIQRLCDVVSKNGNLMLNIPIRGDGSIDSDEEAILDDIGDWFAVNGPAIYGSRPWRVAGEGPTRPPVGEMNEQDAKPFTAQDIRFTVGDGALNVLFLDRAEGEAIIAACGKAAMPAAHIDRVETLDGAALDFSLTKDGLRVSVPPARTKIPVVAIRIRGRGLV